MPVPRPVRRGRALLKAPFPYFGGKSRAADLVWPRLGDVRNFIEPFFGSGAMLLRRPHEPKIETVNDVNCFICNFWRAVQRDPEAVAFYADGPVFETDLHARHAWLVGSRKSRLALYRVRRDPHYFNAKIAGWWCHGACMWIGSGWCDDRQQITQQIPHISNTGQGVNLLKQKIPHMDEARGIISRQFADTENPKRPQLCNGNTAFGQGVHRKPIITSDGGIPELAGSAGRPQLADAYSRGRCVHGNDELTDCHNRRLWLNDWFTRLSDRLRPVRVCCGHWVRVCDSDSTLTRLGTTGVFLDPPYRTKLACGKKNRDTYIYASDKTQDADALCDEVQAWCLKWGGDKQIRIAVCGLEGEYPELDAAGWDKVAWRSRGGYGNRNKQNDNAARERIWFSVGCVQPQTHRQREMFVITANAGRSSETKPMRRASQQTTEDLRL